MRPLLHIARSRATIARPLLRYYSTPSETFIKVNDIPAPGSGRIRILSLSRPSARNAISTTLLQQLRENVQSIAEEYDDYGDEVPSKETYGGAAGPDVKGPTRAVIIASEVDSCFCAGADLKERKKMSENQVNHFLESLRNTFSDLCALPVPTISAISSLALGGGLELALCTTFRVLASTAQVGLPETRIGIIPGAGGTFRLPPMIGQARARDLILTGRRVAAPEAYFLGIANRLVEVVPEEGEAEPELLKRAGDDVLKEAVKLARDICEGAPRAIRASLAATGPRVKLESGNPSGRGPALEIKMYDRVVNTEDRNEALKAFAEKRRPVFTGK
ncbi:ClpP/crotonase-like domain-containing protein [Amylocarpus encephaloides]|uniref:ClpP/crotonase-like domain-containing protein n=1 Tax=Amylocarpus encephaloides TaxID=45428 RepID=A0A9P7YC06_9HELO|nr:ClpP/crotonase-like domain-containing protein [Amylocarpus encephaloides]